VGLLDTARTNGIADGLLGGSKRWLVLGGIAWALRALTWAMRREDRVVYREVLRPGEQLLISERRLQPSKRRTKR
jgi:hypothetical protein